MITGQSQAFKFSRTAVAILVASLLLAAILATITIRNISREQRLMGNFLLKEGMTLIRSFEAGSRTSMMYHMGGNDPLVTLVTETAKTDSVAYIRIIDEHGHSVAQAGEWPQAQRPSLQQLLARDKPTTMLLPDNKIFEITAIFQPLIDKYPTMKIMGDQMAPYCNINQQTGQPSAARQLIFVGLRTTEFDQARQEDVRHSLMMGGILFLVGGAGLYFLFLYQAMQIARVTLRNMELYTENVIASMPAGLITCDMDGRIVSSNIRADELTGKAHSCVHNKRLSEVFSYWPDDITTGTEAIIELSLYCLPEDGQKIPVKVSVSRMMGQGGRQLGRVLILRDMREIRAIEEQLERSRRLAALGQMAAGIAHEIRNPLSTLRGFAQYFRKHAANDQRALNYADIMISEVDRLNFAISALLQFSRPRTPQFANIDPASLLERASKLLEHDFHSKQIKLSLVCDQHLQLRADPDLLLQVIINLLKNSIAATPGGGEVELGCGPHEKGVQIWVCDSGRGMSTAEQEQMFDPFFTTRKDGTGLGLAVSHQIVEQHHGYFDVECTPEDGTRITIVLPPFKEIEQ